MGLQGNSSPTFLAIVFIFSCLAPGVGHSQNRSIPAGDTKSDSSVISCPLDVITIEVRIRNQKGASNLSRENFIVYDNGVRQDIRLWTRIEGSGSEDNEAIYALAYASPVYVPDGKLHKIRVVVRDSAKKKLSVQIAPRDYKATKELFGQVRYDMTKEGLLERSQRATVPISEAFDMKVDIVRQLSDGG